MKRVRSPFDVMNSPPPLPAGAEKVAADPPKAEQPPQAGGTAEAECATKAGHAATEAQEPADVAGNGMGGMGGMGVAMNCTRCGASAPVDGGTHAHTFAIFRYRVCSVCTHRFKTKQRTGLDEHGRPYPERFAG